MAIWDNNSPKRIITINIAGKSLKGTLNVAGLTALTALSCQSNDLTELTGLSGLSSLKSLACYENQLGKLDVSGTGLTALSCYQNELTELTGITNLSSLETLNCYKNQLGKLDVSGTALTYLMCYENELTELTGVSGLSSLQILNCHTNRLDKLDVSGTGLTTLSCYQNELTELTGITNLSSLQTLNCQNNRLDRLDVTGTALTDLSCFKNELTELAGVTGLSSLLTLYCHKNQLNQLNLTGTALTSLSCDQNSFTSFTTKDGHILTVNRAAGGKVWMTGFTINSNQVSLTARPDSRHTFKTWTGLPAGAPGDQTTSFTLNSDLTVAAVFQSTGADATPKENSATRPKQPDNPSSSSDPQPPNPNNPVLAVIELPVTVEDGTATGKPDDGRTEAAMAEAGRDAKAETNGIAVQYDAKSATAYDGFSIVIQRTTLDLLTAAKVKYVTLNTGIVDLTFDPAALQEIQKQSTGDITLTATRETGLTGDALAAVGKRPAYRLTVNYTDADGKAAIVRSFGAGRVTVGLAYQPAATEQNGSLFLVYSKDSKGAEWLYQSGYDRNSGNVISSVGHFSVYGVGCKPAPAFSDTVNHWAKSDIDFVASRGLMAGTGSATFTPDGAVTRGMFVVALGRLAGITPGAYPSGRFTDVAATACYAPYVEWAVSKGIVTGTGDNVFSPDAAITREQMAAVMQRYAGELGYTLPVAREAEVFADEGQMTSGMKDAVQAMQQAGLMNGKGGRRFGPKDAATRAEAAAVLRRFVEIVTDRAAADGWAQNDVGEWLYYENNKPVTGWKQLETTWYCFDAAGLMQAGGWREIGGNWYYFYPDGAMAVKTKIDGYEIGPDGKRKE